MFFYMFLMNFTCWYEELKKYKKIILIYFKLKNYLEKHATKHTAWSSTSTSLFLEGKKIMLEHHV